MKYLTSFKNYSKYKAAKNLLEIPNVSLVEDNDDIYYKPFHDFSKDYLSFVSLEDGNTFTLTIGSDVPISNLTSISYSLDEGETWTTTNNQDNTTVTITTPVVNQGDKVLWKGIGNKTTVGIGNDMSIFSSDKTFNVEGNIMSLLYGDNFTEITGFSTEEGYIFSELFYLNDNIINAGHLILPATTLTESCYREMFLDCTSLLTVPELSATTLADSCYYQMFKGCTSLTTAPVLSATTLASSCYRYMFCDCTSLTTAPELPATTLVSSCYDGMFYNCTSLNSITCLATDISASDCTTNWTENVATNGTFIKAQNVNWTRGSDGIPINWTVNCYYSAMPLTLEVLENGTITFKIPEQVGTDYITSISYSTDNGNTWTTYNNTDNKNADYQISVNVLSGDTVMWRGNSQSMGYYDNETETECYSNFGESTCRFNAYGNIMSLIDFEEDINELDYEYLFAGLFWNSSIVNAKNLVLPATILSERCYQNMFCNCSLLTTAPELPATTLADYCYNEMFCDCTSLTTAPELPATILASGCYYNMFYDCTSLTTAPLLPATTLENYCYQNMFYNCRLLNLVTCLADDVTATNCTRYWLYNVAAAGTFIKSASMGTSWTTGSDGIPSGWIVLDYMKPLTFRALENGTFNFSKSSPSNKLYYSCDDGFTWIKLENSNTSITVNIDYNTTIMFKGNCTPIVNYGGIGKFSSSGRFDVEGNIMSLLYGDDFRDKTNLTNKSYAFYKLFYSCKIVNARNLILPATTLVQSCYGDMFRDCSLLITTPELPATTLAHSCYTGMFCNCSLLTTAPELPATTLTDYCYKTMFYGCSSLTTAPDLPATTLASSCYQNMFYNCTSLTVAPELPATILANYCYMGMFYSCTSLTNAPELLATKLKIQCYDGMFNSCTSLTIAPTLPATTLANACYSNMFSNCTSLTTAPVLNATTLTGSCYVGMFNNCISLTIAPVLNATTMASSCYAYMFKNCTSLTTAPILNATTLASDCYAYMFQGCTSLTTAPELPATTLANYCYRNMFDGCSSLDTITCLATNISASNCTNNWLNGVASNGTFTKAASMSSWTTGINGIPTNWTVQDAS